MVMLEHVNGARYMLVASKEYRDRIRRELPTMRGNGVTLNGINIKSVHSPAFIFTDEFINLYLFGTCLTGDCADFYIPKDYVEPVKKALAMLVFKLNIKDYGEEWEK